jgi:hypothetical protein
MSNDTTTTTTTTTPSSSSTHIQNLDIFSLNDDNNPAKYCYYYDSSTQQQQHHQQNQQYNNDNLFYTPPPDDPDDLNLDLTLKKLVIKFEWLKYDLKTPLKRNNTDNLDNITLICSYCNNINNCDKQLLEKFEPYLETENQLFLNRNYISILTQLLNYHQQTNEHKIACASTYLADSTSTTIHQQPDSTIIITNLDTITPQSSSPSSSNSYLLLDNNNNNNKSSPTSTNGCFKDEEIESCLNSHDLVVNDNYILESLANNNDFYNSSSSSSNTIITNQNKKNEIQQYGSILKAINKRKLHISCPLCASKVVNMSDHLVKKHNIKDRYQRKHLMDSVRRNYLASNINVNEISQNNNNNSKRSSPVHNFLIRQNSTPNKQQRKLIKCPICVDENKYFVNISDHLIKIHHLNTSEMRKPILKSIKNWNKNNTSGSSQQQLQQQQQVSGCGSSNSSSYDSTFVMLVDQQHHNDIVNNLNKTAMTTTTTTTTTDEILIISDQTNEDDYLINLNDRFEEEAVAQQQQQIQHVEFDNNNNNNNNNNNSGSGACYVNLKYQQIKKNDIRKSILKRYSKRIRKVKTNGYNQYARKKCSKMVAVGDCSSRSSSQVKHKLIDLQQQNMFSLLKLESNANAVSNQLDSIIDLNQSSSNSNSNNNNNNNQYYSNSSILINQQNNNCLVYQQQQQQQNDNVGSNDNENQQDKIQERVIIFY